MTRTSSVSALGWLIAAAAALVPHFANAQDSGQVVRIVVPFPPGNALDSAARALAESLHKTIKRNYIVDNKPGAGSVIGSTEVARAKPDGTVLLYTTGGHATNAALYRKLPFDSIKDFTPVTQISSSAGFLLLVNATSPYRTAQEFIAAAKADPGKLSYGSFGVGNTTHLVGALFARSAGLNLMHVPYKTSPIPDLLGGHIDAMFLGSSIARPLLEQGTVRALATSGDTRGGSLPNVPTFSELGFKGVDVPAWSGLLAPSGMSLALAEQIRNEVAEAVRQPEYIAVTKIMETKSVVSSPKDFAAYLAGEIARLKTQLAPLGIEMD